MVFGFLKIKRKSRSPSPGVFDRPSQPYEQVAEPTTAPDTTTAGAHDLQDHYSHQTRPIDTGSYPADYDHQPYDPNAYADVYGGVRTTVGAEDGYTSGSASYSSEFEKLSDNDPDSAGYVDQLGLSEAGPDYSVDKDPPPLPVAFRGLGQQQHSTQHETIDHGTSLPPLRQGPPPPALAKQNNIARLGTPPKRGRPPVPAFGRRPEEEELSSPGGAVAAPKQSPPQSRPPPQINYNDLSLSETKFAAASSSSGGRAVGSGRAGSTGASALSRDGMKATLDAQLEEKRKELERLDDLIMEAKKRAGKLAGSMQKLTAITAHGGEGGAHGGEQGARKKVLANMAGRSSWPDLVGMGVVETETGEGRNELERKKFLDNMVDLGVQSGAGVGGFLCVEPTSSAGKKVKRRGRSKAKAGGQPGRSASKTSKSSSPDSSRAPSKSPSRGRSRSPRPPPRGTGAGRRGRSSSPRSPPPVVVPPSGPDSSSRSRSGAGAGTTPAQQREDQHSTRVIRTRAKHGKTLAVVDPDEQLLLAGAEIGGMITRADQAARDAATPAGLLPPKLGAAAATKKQTNIRPDSPNFPRPAFGTGLRTLLGGAAKSARRASGGKKRDSSTGKQDLADLVKSMQQPGPDEEFLEDRRFQKLARIYSSDPLPEQPVFDSTEREKWREHHYRPEHPATSLTLHTIRKPNTQLIKDLVDRIVRLEPDITASVDKPLQAQYFRRLKAGEKLNACAEDIHFLAQELKKRRTLSRDLATDLQEGNSVDRCLQNLHIPRRLQTLKAQTNANLSDLADILNEFHEVKDEFLEGQRGRELQDRDRRKFLPTQIKEQVAWNIEAKGTITECRADHEALKKNVEGFEALTAELQERVAAFERAMGAQFGLQTELLSRWLPIEQAVSGILGSENMRWALRK